MKSCWKCGSEDAKDYIRAQDKTFWCQHCFIRFAIPNERMLTRIGRIMTNFCNQCEKQDHESNMIYEDKTWWCRECFFKMEEKLLKLIDNRCCRCAAIHDEEFIWSKEQQWWCRKCAINIYIPNGAKLMKEETVNHPNHYQGNGIEAIDVIEAFSLGFNMGNAIKYLLRAGKKGDKIEDLKKAQWYLEREILNLEEENVNE